MAMVHFLGKAPDVLTVFTGRVHHASHTVRGRKSHANRARRKIAVR